MIVIGLTGSIGMGKSMISAMFAYQGVPVHDADQEVHALLSNRGKAYAAVTGAFPYYAYPQIYRWRAKDGQSLNRQALGKIIFKDQKAREKLEAILHPLVREAQSEFLKTQKRSGCRIAVLDIPLLFETGAEKFLDYTITVSSPAFLQKSRVLVRPGMTEQKFYDIVNNQMMDREKRARADFVINNGLSRGHVMRQVKDILNQIKEESSGKIIDE